MRYRIAAFMFSLLVSTGAFAAQITGTVTNATTNKPSSGDEVTLLSLANGMQEVGSTKTDSQGHYTLNVPDQGGQHLVRVARNSVHFSRLHHQALRPSTSPCMTRQHKLKDWSLMRGSFICKPAAAAWTCKSSTF